MAAGTPQGLVAAFLARDRGRPVAPRRGRFLDLTCLEPRLETLPLVVPDSNEPRSTVPGGRSG